MDSVEKAFSLAEEFCRWCHEPPGAEREEAKRLLALLLDLSRAAAELDLPPDVDPKINGHRPGDDENNTC